MRPATTARTTSRVAATALVTLLAGVALAATPAVARPAGQDPLRHQAEAIRDTGAVGVVAESATAGGRRHHAAAGLADTAGGRAARPGDVFRIGSSTKTFTATVMLQLEAEGLLSLDDTVESHLPGVVSGNGNDGRAISLRDLLQRTSGLYDYLNDLPTLTGPEGFEENRLRHFEPRELVDMAMRHESTGEPGTWKYSNTNYILAGMIIEETTGRSWQTEVTERIIEPLHLEHTYAPADQPFLPTHHLNGYSAFHTEGTPLDVTVWNPSAAGAAGAMVSNTEDLTTFYQALFGGDLLPARQLAEMTRTTPAPGTDAPDRSYGLGLYHDTLPCGGGYWSHPGDVVGYATRNGISEDGQRIVVVEFTGDGDYRNDTTEQATDALIRGRLCATEAERWRS
ncbi:serine hydrolase domain-containing protein [Streptomyces hoynatensis]|uniref:Class A beta-lactamase-related serine hydrolase n=1 Tax=Streptomyces hoynatensis TaxID=1141874 RepID=A0A3A9ZBU0_9ACTN|nr:serine hydrolase domain-containing protein [Streptomyces hoynatensis]RKN45579.1 class A beta-lactamase-related serine hydrolase [Streptomyces hoynatensis]